MNFASIQMDELYAKVEDEEKLRWLWLVINPVTKVIPTLYLGELNYYIACSVEI